MPQRSRAPAAGDPAPFPVGPGRNGVGREHAGGHEQICEIQRGRMLAAMAELAAERGAVNLTIADVVARSGVSRRTFYEMFVDREDCLLAAFDDALRRIAAVVVPAYEEPSRWSEKIRAGLSALLEILDYERVTGRLLIVETLGAGPAALERRRRVIARIVAAVEEGRGEVRQGEGPPPLLAEGIVGGVLAVLHSRLLAGPTVDASGDMPLSAATASDGPGSGEGASASLLSLVGPLMSMIVLPYLGAAAARREAQRPVSARPARQRVAPADPLRDVGMRLTYRTVRVLMAVAEQPGSSNREVGIASGMGDQGQISKLLSRLHRLGLIQNTGIGPSKGAPNAWTLTPKGTEIERAVGR